jgi:hypothetical protein
MSSLRFSLSRCVYAIALANVPWSLAWGCRVRKGLKNSNEGSRRPVLKPTKSEPARDVGGCPRGTLPRGHGSRAVGARPLDWAALSISLPVLTWRVVVS